MSFHNLSRRNLLKQLAAATAAASIPTFLRNAASYAEPGAQMPRRVLVLFSPNGPQFVEGPTMPGSESTFALHEWWAPLERHKADGFFFRQCHHPGVPFGTHNEYGHQSGSIGALTARTTMGTNTATGPSLDQFIAQELFKRGVVSPKRSLLWGASEADGIFYEAAGRTLKPTVNPYQALEDIASGFGANGSAAIRSALVRKHFVLDQNRAECARLRARMGAQGKALLDAHCTNIEALESGVAKSLERAALACKGPTGPISPMPKTTAWGDSENRDHTLKAFADLMALTFSCDITRVLGFQFGGGASRFAIPGSYKVPSSGVVDSQDSGAQMHAWTHNGGDANHMPALKIFYNWFSEAVARFIDTLKATPDADGKPLFDTTLVLWTSEFGAGGSHSNARVPIMLFGKGAGKFKSGRMFQGTLGDAQKEALPIHQLFVSIARHAGLTDVDSFGNHGSLTCGPLAWLEG
jgi:Protein of unknown function (DUF1552)